MSAFKNTIGNCDFVGYKHLDTKEECIQAATELGLADLEPTEGSWSTNPTGCYVKVSTGLLYWNLIGDAADNDVTRVSVCKRLPMSECADDPAWRDSWSDTCGWYTTYACSDGAALPGQESTITSSASADGRSALDACCACGGGTGGGAFPLRPFARRHQARTD